MITFSDDNEKKIEEIRLFAVSVSVSSNENE